MWVEVVEVEGEEGGEGGEDEEGGDWDSVSTLLREGTGRDLRRIGARSNNMTLMT